MNTSNKITKRIYTSIVLAASMLLATGAQAIDPPTMIAAAVTETDVTVSWTAATDATGYNVYRDGVYITSVDTLSYLDMGLQEQTDYIYSVTTYGVEPGMSALSYSIQSEEVMVTTGVNSTSQVCTSVTVFFPNASIPQNVYLVPDNAGSADLYWDAVADAQGYLIHLNGVYVDALPASTPLPILVAYTAGDLWSVSSTNGSLHSPRSDDATVGAPGTPPGGGGSTPLTDAQLIAAAQASGVVLLGVDPNTDDSDGDLVTDALDTNAVNACVPYINAAACQAFQI